MLLEALQQEVVNGRKVVVAAVLQGLWNKVSGVRVRPWLQRPLDFPVRLCPGNSQAAKNVPRGGDKLVLKLDCTPFLTLQARACFA